MNELLEAIGSDEVVPFDMYFATIVGMNNHPGFQREGAKRLTMEGCAAQAVKMLTIRRTLIPSEKENV